MKANGKLYPQGSSACLDVSITFDSYPNFEVFIEESEELIRLSAQDINVSPKLGSVPREVSIDNIGMLILDSRTDVDEWLDSEQKTRIHKFEKNRKLVLISIIAVPLVLFSLFKFVLPAVAIGFAAWVPDGAVRVASSHTLSALERTVLEPATLPEGFESEILEYWEGVIDQLETDHEHYNILFYQSELLGANAFALPDGTIVFTQGIVELFEDDRDLLTAVLLHEIGHVEYHHSMRLIAETLVTSLAISYFFGDVSGIFELFGGATSTVINNQYTQELEWEADNYALQQMPLIGLEPQTFADAMTKFAEEYGEGGSTLEALLSTHPSLKERIENAETVD